MSVSLDGPGEGRAISLTPLVSMGTAKDTAKSLSPSPRARQGTATTSWAAAPYVVWSFAPRTTIPSVRRSVMRRSVGRRCFDGGRERSPLGSIIPHAMPCPLF